MEANPLGWFQAGASIAARRQDQRLQTQQLKAQESDRAIKERLLAAQIAQTDLENQKIKAEITARAQADAEWLDINTAISKQQAALNTAKELGLPAPQFDPTAALDEAAIRIAGSNPNAQKYLSSRAVAENFRSDMERRKRDEEDRQFTPKGMVDPTTGAPMIEEAPGRWQSFAPPSSRAGTEPEIERIFKAAKAEGQPLSPQQRKLAREVHLGLKAKPGSDPQVLSETAWIIKTLPEFKKSRAARKDVTEPATSRFGKATVRSVPMTDEEAIEALRSQYRAVMGAVGAAGQEGEAASPASAESVQALRNQIKADLKAGKLTREQALEALRKTGMK